MIRPRPLSPLPPRPSRYDLVDDRNRLFDIRDKVLDCFGGDASSVHLAGHSKGGQMAFRMMLRRPELFVTERRASSASSNPTGGERLCGKCGALHRVSAEFDESIFFEFWSSH